MSTHFTWQSAVLDSDCESSTKLVLLAIGSFMNQHGTGAFPSLETLAAKTSLTKLTVRRHVQVAESIGWLAVKKRYTRNGDKDSNLYSIRYPNEVGSPLTHVGSPVTQGGLAINPQVGSPVTHNTPVLTPQVTPHKNKGASPPDWLPQESWEGFVEMRKTIRKPMTPRAVSMILKKLEGFMRAGHDVGAILDQSVVKSWQDVFPVKQAYQGQPHRTDKQEQAKAFMDVLTGRSDSYDATDPFTIDAPATRVA